MQKEIPILHGVFSRDSLPSSWKTSHNQGETKMLVEIAQASIPSAEVVGEIPRSSNSITVLFKNNGKLFIAQLGPQKSIENANTDNWERQNSNKFANVSFINEIQQGGVNIPRVYDFGTRGERSYILMEFIPGTSADKFMDRWPEKSSLVFQEAGKQIGQLASLTIPKELKEKSKPSLIEKLQPFLNFLENKQIISTNEKVQIARSLTIRLELLNSQQNSLVHLDPFPVNWHITGSPQNFKVSLLDLEAIGVGHPLVEGIGRALQWAAEDWFWIKKKPEHVGKFETMLAEGFNSTVKENLRITIDPKELTFLKDTAELAWLPEAIVYEFAKEKPSEGPERRKNNLLNIISKQI